MNNNLSSEFGDAINKDHPLPQHPNPLFRRDSFVSLNGLWDFALDKNKSPNVAYTKKILVPFSPETSLSGLKIKIPANTYMHYRKEVSVPDSYVNHDAILHFGAVDQVCDIYWNGHFVGHHESGYSAFEIPLSCLSKNNVLELVVNDDTSSGIYPRGKQSTDPAGIWYTPTSGIWQTVWLETIPDEGYVQSIRIDPDFDNQEVKITAKFVGNRAFATAEVYYKGQLVAKDSFTPEGEATLDLKYVFYPWSPEEPNLYELLITAGYDTIHSYFAMRKFSSVTVGKFHLFALNNHPYFLSGVLDQGYFPESGLTPPSEEAIINDIALVKKCGYNCIRKHIKIEPMRWYFQCDRMGIIVLQDFVNGGSCYSSLLVHTRPVMTFDISDTNYRLLGRLMENSRKQFIRDLEATIANLYNVPSIAIWTIFNEGWGQFDTEVMTAKVKDLDPSRLVDSASGWYDKKCGDFDSQHIYFWLVSRIKNDRKRITGLSEFGGYTLKVPKHAYSDRFIWLSFLSFFRYLE
jgi:beta-galactosidase/beta-glucuronidase